MKTIELSPEQVKTLPSILETELLWGSEAYSDENIDNMEAVKSKLEEQ